MSFPQPRYEFHIEHHTSRKSASMTDGILLYDTINEARFTRFYHVSHTEGKAKWPTFL